MQRFGMKLTKPKSIQSFFKDLDDAAKLEKKVNGWPISIYIFTFNMLLPY